jgi:hypothetical protein
VDADATFGTAGIGLKVKLVGDGDAGLKESIILIRPEADGVQVDTEHAAVGAKRRTEEVTFPSRLQVKAAGKASETSGTFEEAMDRAQALLDIVIEELRDNPPSAGDQSFQPLIESHAFDPLVIDQGWGVICDFDITVRIRVS